MRSRPLLRMILLVGAGIAGCGPEVERVSIPGVPNSGGPIVPPTPSRSASVDPLPVPQTNRSVCFTLEVESPETATAQAVRAIDRQLADCQVSPPVDACRFQVARQVYELHKLELAVPVLLAIAHDPSTDHSIALGASEYARDGLATLSSTSKTHRAECKQVFAAEVPKLHRELCAPNTTERECATLDSVRFQLERDQAQKLVQDAEKENPLNKGLMSQAGHLYREAAARRCFEHKGKPPEMCDELLYNAVLVFRAASEPSDEAESLKLLTDPANGMSASPLAKKAMEKAH